MSTTESPSMTPSRPPAHRQAPSLAEILALGLPLAAALATAVLLLSPQETDPRLTRTRDDLRLLRSALLLGHPGRSGLPDTQEGLSSLVRAGILPHLPEDPWGRPYQYRYPGHAYTYELFSLGPDGVESSDDVVAWNLYGGR